jgi:hypothetical protein
MYHGKSWEMKEDMAIGLSKARHSGAKAPKKTKSS